MSAHWMLLASQPVHLTTARSQMGFTLAFHILLVPPTGTVLSFEMAPRPTGAHRASRRR